MEKCGKIVVVDHGDSADWITGTLSRNGFDPVLFDSAIKCFRYFECGDTADLIIVNLYLPVISGWHFARMVRSPEFSYLNEVNKALTAKQGRKEAELTLPDVILLDHHLPDLPGIEIFPKLKAAGDPAIIIMTADPDPDLSVQYARIFQAPH